MPLEGIRVLEWGIWQVGPVAAALLGSLGAEVIKLESTDTGDPNRHVLEARGIPTMLPNGSCMHHELYNRNKKSIAIDLKNPEGRALVYKLVEKCDVFLHNFRKRVTESLGMDYDTLSKYNPKLIYASATGYGPEGPDADKPAMDMTGVARSGFMLACGEPGQPPQAVGGATGDQIGAIFTAYGVLVGLLARERLGIAQKIDTSILGGLISLLEVPVALASISGKEFPRQDRKNARNPLWNWYKCKDNRWIIFASFQSDRYWPSFCQALGMAEIERDPRFKDMSARSQNCQTLISILDEVFATKTYQEWEKIFEKQNVIFGPVNSIKDLFEDAQVKANKYVVDIPYPGGTIKAAGYPVSFSKTPANSVRSRAPEWGEHTEEILMKLGGYSWEEIAEFRDKKLIV